MGTSTPTMAHQSRNHADPKATALVRRTSGSTTGTTQGPPHCLQCGGLHYHAARTRTLCLDSKEVVYLAYLWRCFVCGYEWEGEDLRRLNAEAAARACTIAAGH